MKPFLAVLRDDLPCELRAPCVARLGAASLIGELRLDDRRTLARALDVDAAAIGDAELALHAWRRWKGDCVAHLFGDFSFVIHEANEWLGARDRFGVRPFYYARADGALFVSNSLEAILANPAVDADALDDRAVADYLHGATPEDAEATIYAQVRRLPPAHTLSPRGGMQRYWSLPPRGAPRPDAREQFEAALQAAVADRVTGPSAVVFMSGGLDSSALAALAHELDPRTRILAATSVYRTRIADVEESFAAEAARSIGIPIRVFALDEWTPLHSLESGTWTAEPGPLLTASMTRAIYAAAAEHAPVALHGHPADAVLSADLARSTRTLLDSRRYARLIASLVRYWRVKRRPPWFFLRDLLGRPRPPRPRSSPPAWLRPELAERIIDVPPEHALQSPMWASFFEWAHPLQTGAPIELAYPWCDLRVIDAAFALDPFPWLVDKHVLRELLRGRGSERIRTRPKTFLQGDPWIVPLQADAPVEIDAAERYIDPVRFEKDCRAAGMLSDATLRAVALAWWLRERPQAIRRLRA